MNINPGRARNVCDEIIKFLRLLVSTVSPFFWFFTFFFSQTVTTTVFFLLSHLFLTIFLGAFFFTPYFFSSPLFLPGSSLANCSTYFPSCFSLTFLHSPPFSPSFPLAPLASWDILSKVSFYSWCLQTPRPLPPFFPFTLPPIALLFAWFTFRHLPYYLPSLQSPCHLFSGTFIWEHLA